MADAPLFRLLGRRIGDELRAVLADVGAPLGLPGQRALDFGCGCGRVLRFLREEAARADFHAVDVDAEAIAWCAERLAGTARFQEVSPDPPLPFPDATFDVIYGISVFTHLPEDDQLRWLPELARVLRPDGVLLLSVHGEAVARLLTAPVRAALHADGLVYAHDGGTPGLPERYQSCFHTRDYVLRTWTRFFDVERYLEAAIMFSQDAVVLRRPGGGRRS